MKREIKFRAWDGKKMHYNCIVGNGQVVYIPDAIGEYRFNSMAEVTPLEWTGLKDSNGTDIYEDDIMIYDFIGGLNKRVIFLEGSFGVLNRDELRGNSFGSYQINNGVVVGNIYENPELLKPTQKNKY